MLHLSWNSEPSCLSLPRARMTGLYPLHRSPVCRFCCLYSSPGMLFHRGASQREVEFTECGLPYFSHISGVGD